MMAGGWYDDEAIETERLDADLEMAELTAAGNREYRLRKAGKCPHGWHGPADNDGGGIHGASIARQCYHCEKVFPSESALLAERRERLS